MTTMDRLRAASVIVFDESIPRDRAVLVVGTEWGDVVISPRDVSGVEGVALLNASDAPEIVAYLRGRIAPEKN